MPAPSPPSAVRDETLLIMDAIDIPLDSIWCLVCCREILPKDVHVSIRPHPTLHPPIPVVGIHDDEDSPVCFSHIESGAVRPRAQRLAHGVMPEAPIRVSSAKVIPSDTTSHMVHHDSDPAHPFRRSMAVNQIPAPFCSDQCRFANRRSYHSAIDIEYNPTWRKSPCLPSAPPNSPPDIHDSEDDSDQISEASSESLSSASSPPDTDYAANAYSHLCTIYDFAPLPPPPPFVRKKVTTSAKEPAPLLEGGIIMAARRIQAALCIDKQTKSSWGVPIDGNSEDDTKPIPGWTDGSNAWRPSVYGFAPPRDFTRADPDDAAIRAYGSYVATPHRSRGVGSTLDRNEPTVEVQTAPSSPSAADASTQELYRQYCASFARRSQSRTSIHNRGAGFPISPTGSTRHNSREVPLLKPGAEGRLLVPNVKMRLLSASFSTVDGSSSKNNSPVVGGPHCTPSQQNGDAGLNADRTESYKSEIFTYPIMRVTPKTEKRVERRIVDGVERDVEVEVLVEEPIKRLFLFGGARD